MLTLLSALFLPASDTEEVLKAKQGLDEPLVLPMGKYFITACIERHQMVADGARAPSSLMTEQNKVMRVVEDALQKSPRMLRNFQQHPKEDQDGP